MLFSAIFREESSSTNHHRAPHFRWHPGYSK